MYLKIECIIVLNGMVDNVSYTVIICEWPSDFTEIPFLGLNILKADLVMFWLKK